MRIALTGKLRSGKDTAGEHLRKRYRFEQYAFGNALKRTYHEVFPWVPAYPKPRAGYQQFGQLMRQLDANVWVKSVERLMEGAEVCGIYDHVITDLRQPNEYEWARANGFVIVRVTAGDELRLARAEAAGDAFTAEDLAHETEQHIDGFAVDYELTNDGTAEELLVKVDELVATISPAQT